LPPRFYSRIPGIPGFLYFAGNKIGLFLRRRLKPRGHHRLQLIFKESLFCRISSYLLILLPLFEFLKLFILSPQAEYKFKRPAILSIFVFRPGGQILVLFPPTAYTRAG